MVPCPSDEFLILTVVSYSGEEWTGRASDPGSSGSPRGPGIAVGNVYELQSVKKTGSDDRDYVTFYVPGPLEFPALIMTQREESRAGAVVMATGTRDSAELEMDEEKVLIFRKGAHTEIECTLTRGGIKNIDISVCWRR
jgi:hypothetical protein